MSRSTQVAALANLTVMLESWSLASVSCVKSFNLGMYPGPHCGVCLSETWTIPANPTSRIRFFGLFSGNRNLKLLKISNVTAPYVASRTQRYKKVTVRCTSASLSKRLLSCPCTAMGGTAFFPSPSSMVCASSSASCQPLSSPYKIFDRHRERTYHHGPSTTITRSYHRVSSPPVN